MEKCWKEEQLASKPEEKHQQPHLQMYKMILKVLEIPSGGGGAGRGTGGVDLNSIFMGSCGLQYITFAGKAFPCQRFVYFEELRVLTEHLIHNFDDSLPEGLEGKYYLVVHVQLVVCLQRKINIQQKYTYMDVVI